MLPSRFFRLLVLTTVLGIAAAARAQERVPLRPAEFDRLGETIRPSRGEARWAEVDWMPASDIWAARQKAAAEGKPLLLWYMAGEPLGSC